MAAERLKVMGIEKINDSAIHLDTRTTRWYAQQLKVNGVRTYPTFTSYFAKFAPVWAKLSKGSKGKDVEAVQLLLNVKADGVMGPLTEAALKSFQKSSGLSVDGICGPKTYAKLMPALDNSSKAPLQLRAIQTKLGCPVTGVYDGATASAIYRMQLAKGVPVKWAIEANTWRAIFS
jgi:peptidoglycan hydrolase-like protein with peptidoglycan-binding domain